MTIYLPQLEAGAGEITEEGGQQKEAAPAGPAGKRILVVDDEELVRGMSEQVLKAHGYDVLTAGDGEEGVRVFQAGHREIDLVILDMIMPRMSGREAFLEMKKIHPEVRAILASGFSGDGEAREVLKLGIRGYVQNPFRVAPLLAAVGKALG
jgi:CheY-like chemotaxis protein